MNENPSIQHVTKLPDGSYQREHQHKFNIPVEWMQEPAHLNGAIIVKEKTKVTKLKCTGCNEEQDR